MIATAAASHHETGRGEMSLAAIAGVPPTAGSMRAMAMAAFPLVQNRTSVSGVRPSGGWPAGELNTFSHLPPAVYRYSAHGAEHDEVARLPFRCRLPARLLGPGPEAGPGVGRPLGWRGGQPDDLG